MVIGENGQDEFPSDFFQMMVDRHYKSDLVRNDVPRGFTITDEYYAMKKASREVDNIPEVHGVVTREKNLVMDDISGYFTEYINGGHLESRLEDDSLTDPSATVDQLTEMIRDLHSVGIYHGDLYGNVLVKENRSEQPETPWIIDFAVNSRGRSVNRMYRNQDREHINQYRDMAGLKPEFDLTGQVF